MTDIAYRFGPQLEDGRTRFRLWAPESSAADLIVQGWTALPMTRQADGMFEAVAECGVGTRYKFRIGELEFPDLASRQQDDDTDGWSVVCAPMRASEARPRPWHEMVLCEVHVGSATPEGSFNALKERLEHFRDAGYTGLEIMPVNECPGARNWGYDGTLIFAPEAAYGTPADLRDLIERAHQLGLTIILDVVYNHFGSVDNFAGQYLQEWFDNSIETPWGPGIDFNKEPVRQFYYENAIMWLAEYGFDGLRLDAVHEIKSEETDRFLGELAATARAVRPGARLILENMNNGTHWLERDARNRPMTYTAQWNEDLHHVLTYVVAGEGKKTGYGDGADPIADLEKALADGFVHDHDEGSQSDGRTRGGPSAQLPPDAFVTYVDNHDQIGNRADLKRLSARIEPRQLDFVHFVKFIAPQIPLCFMGDEGSLDMPFPFFVDMSEADGEAANTRRYTEMRDMFNEKVAEGGLPHPNDLRTFEMAKLKWSAFDEEPHRSSLHRFRELAGIRRQMVWPLSATPCLDAITARHGNGLILNWIFAAGTLSLALNPAGAAMDMPCVIQGAPVFSGTFHQHGEVLRLGPWSAVAWRNP